MGTQLLSYQLAFTKSRDSKIDTVTYRLDVKQAAKEALEEKFKVNR